MLQQFLTWGVISLGGAFVALLTWFAMRVVNQLDKITDLFTTEIHAHDIRITRLEVGAGFTRRQNDQAD